MDTIFAEATPPGRGGVSVIRLSGPESRLIAEKLAGPLADARHAYFRPLSDGGEVIDQAIVIRFDAGQSFTGEESAELHLHGAPVVVRRVESALRKHGVRRAEAGEFTMRSFLSGRVDLAEVEGLSDLLRAETEVQRKQAMALANGDLGRLVESWREDLVHAGAMLTASIDFADEEIPDDVADGVQQVVARVLRSMRQQLDGYPAASRIRSGFVVAIVGLPNAGKSSLLNRIAGKEMAIVTEIPGTTRDVVEFHADLKGLPVTFLDTAGLRETDDVVEKIGVDRAVTRAEDADLRIFLGPAIPAQIKPSRDDIVVASKADLSGNPEGISAVTGQGVQELLELVYDRLSGRIAGASLIGHDRQTEDLQGAISALEDCSDAEAEIFAEAIRVAGVALARLIGRIDVDDYLDVVFSSFCIGK